MIVHTFEIEDIAKVYIYDGSDAKERRQRIPLDELCLPNLVYLGHSPRNVPGLQMRLEIKTKAFYNAERMADLISVRIPLELASASEELSAKLAEIAGVKQYWSEFVPSKLAVKEGSMMVLQRDEMIFNKFRKQVFALLSRTTSIKKQVVLRSNKRQEPSGEFVNTPELWVTLFDDYKLMTSLPSGHETNQRMNETNPQVKGKYIFGELTLFGNKMGWSIFCEYLHLQKLVSNVTIYNAILHTIETNLPGMMKAGMIDDIRITSLEKA